MSNKQYKISWGSRVPDDVRRKPIVFVSSTVYDKKDMLDHIRMQLENAGYDVRMSHAGTIPVDSASSAYENCLNGVRDADFFIGIISPSYGSGIIASTRTSITHEEMRLAIRLKLPRLMLVDERVKVATDFVNHLGFRGEEGRKALVEYAREYAKKNLKGKGKDPLVEVTKICDLRVMSLYDEILLGENPQKKRDAENRIGNWIQEFRTIEDFKRFISTQFTYLQVTDSYEGLSEASRLLETNLPTVRYKECKT